VLKIDVDRVDKLLAVEKGSNGYLNAGHSTLQLEDFDFVGESLLVGFEHANYILSIIFLSDEQPALHILRFAARLDYVSSRVLCNVLNGIVERIELLVGDDVHSGFLQFLLPERAVIFQSVGVGSA